MTPTQGLDRRAIFYGLSSYFFWGFFPMYWKLLSRLPATEILAHRFVWSFVFYAAIYWFTDRQPGKLQILFHQDKKSWCWALAAAFLLAINWGIYIYAVNSGQVLQGSLAYFINPLLVVGVGVFLFKEPFPAVLKIAIGLAAIGVFYQAAFTPTLPWIAVSLAISFCSYGIIKKRLLITPQLSSLMEGAAGLIPALLVALMLRQNSSVELTQTEWLWLAGSGVITGLPLFCFSYAAQKLPYSLMGMMQFIGPSLQFLVGYFLYKEHMSLANFVSFGLIWSGVGFYLIYQIHKLRVARTDAIMEPKLNSKTLDHEISAHLDTSTGDCLSRDLRS